jgi:hypothetical protein
MKYVQVVNPNANIQGTLGMCLNYVQRAYSVGWAGSSAWDAWTKRVSRKHQDRDLPSGVAVPVWFDGYWNGSRLGHVGIYVDGKVYCSPWKAGQKYATLASIAEVERIYGMKYVGWSEDLSGVNLIKQKEEEMKELTSDQIDRAFRMSLGKLPEVADINSTKYKQDAGLLIDSLWNNGGRQRYEASGKKPVTSQQATKLKPGLYEV